MGDGERELLTQTILESQTRLLKTLCRQDEPEWMASDLTMPQFKILSLLYGRGPMRMSGLAKLLDRNMSTATGIADRLVEEKLIQRQEDSEDRRAVIIRLTERGQELCESFMQQDWHRLRSMLKRLNLDELQVVLRSIELLTKAMLDQINEQSQVVKT
ncbi:MAG: MarR family transcriptional regulator [Chloroflexota bacterium]|nr:MarR family transcriptional regulator [Chloroflexota bacterium]